MYDYFIPSFLLNILLLLFFPIYSPLLYSIVFFFSFFFVKSDSSQQIKLTETSWYLSVVAFSSSEAEYCAMAHGTCELLWLKTLMLELGFVCEKPMLLHCDNNSARHIATNPFYHERT